MLTAAETLYIVAVSAGPGEANWKDLPPQYEICEWVKPERGQNMSNLKYQKSPKTILTKTIAVHELLEMIPDWEHV